MKTEGPIYSQITADVRKRIFGGEFQPGDKLPPMHDMAREYGTSYFTIQTALTPLVEEDLLERRRRIGTVVKYNAKVLTCAGIYCSGALMDEWEYAFYRELCRQLRLQLAEKNIRTELFLDTRPEEERTVPQPALARAVDGNEIQALFIVLSDEPSNLWLDTLPIASSYATSWPASNGVTYSDDSMYRLAVEQLHKRGCRSVGLISCVANDHDEKIDGYDKTFRNTSEQLGMDIRDAWIIRPDQYTLHHDRFGYDAFNRIWQNDDRPEGLFVFPDISCKGTMTAALEQGVRIPDELKLVFHHNSGVDWNCPLTVDWVESDVGLWAAEMIRQILQLKDGQIVERVILPYQIRQAERMKEGG